MHQAGIPNIEPRQRSLPGNREDAIGNTDIAHEDARRLTVTARLNRNVNLVQVVEEKSS